MKHNVIRTVFSLTMFLLSLAAAALAQDTNCPCSNRNMMGVWGTIQTGTVILPTSAVPFANVIHVTYDPAGNLEGTQTRSLNGTISHVTFRGTYIVNTDCTGTKTVSIYDQSGNLMQTATLDFVLMNNANELFEVITSNTLSNGTSIPVVATGHSMKLFPNRDNGLCYWTFAQ